MTSRTENGQVFIMGRITINAIQLQVVRFSRALGHESQQSRRQERRGPAYQRKAGEYQNQHRETVPAHRPRFIRYGRKVQNCMAGFRQRLLSADRTFQRSFERVRDKARE